MGTRLFIGNLPFSADEESVRGFFEQAGSSVRDVTIVRDRITQQARGFGFVTLGTEEQAADALRSLDGTELGGRPLVIKQAEPRGSRPRPIAGDAGSRFDGGPRFAPGAPPEPFGESRSAFRDARPAPPKSRGSRRHMRNKRML